MFDVVKDIAVEVASDFAADYISDMIINYNSSQTEGEYRVADTYRQRHGALPQSPLASSYKTEVLPCKRVARGSQITFSSTVELVSGQNKQSVNVMETLTIWENEDPSVELKSVSKSLTGGATTGGIFNDQVIMSFPGGTYPISTAVTLDGEPVRSDKNHLEIVGLEATNSGERIAYRY